MRGTDDGDDGAAGAGARRGVVAPLTIDVRRCAGTVTDPPPVQPNTRSLA
ncbi:unannotated protein [freshwater metagenome]|uniref:Unannotated protein n=1 Tax=freshwater metagenome TaxID=449393 RepID=A0A6J7HG60_9ZZZZ